MHDRRLTTRLIKYWERLRKDEALPPFNRFNSGAIQDIWDTCFHVSVQPGSQMFHYQYMGPKIVDAYGVNLTGSDISEKLRHIPGSQFFQKMDNLLEEYTPMENQGQFINEKNKTVKYRSCMVPFGTDEKGVTDVIAGLSWKAF